MVEWLGDWVAGGWGHACLVCTRMQIIVPPQRQQQLFCAARSELAPDLVHEVALRAQSGPNGADILIYPNRL